MFTRYHRLRIKRKFRRQSKVLEQAGSTADRQFEYHVVRRWRNLRDVKRFVFGWLLLVAIMIVGVFIQTRALSAYYLEDQPIAGGVYREALKGEFTNINPIYASTNADLAASKLVFSSLFKYDPKGRIVGDLASNYESKEDAKIYTITLRDNLFWHDGTPLTAEDVEFTYDSIQHPDSRSVLAPSWQGIKVQAVDERTVTFTLPNAFTPFPHSLTQGGIIPRHILSGVEPSALRSHPFNLSEPIGSGPFSFDSIARVNDTNHLNLSNFSAYHFGEPNIAEVILIGHNDDQRLLNSFTDGEVAAAADISNNDFNELSTTNDAQIYEMPLMNGIYLFMKNSNEILSTPELRKALTQATDQSSILLELESRFVAVDSALLKDQPGYSKKLTQAKYNLEEAKRALDELGWTIGDDGIRINGDQRLSFSLVTQNTDNYPAIAEMVKQQWQEVGAELNVILADDTQIRSNHIIPHNYDVLLFGISIGYDPDVFAYWHSSQKGPGGFNLAEYESAQADAALEAGRTRAGRKLRNVKYRPFLEAWQKDAPSIGILQPGFIYAQQDRVRGFEPRTITSGEERFNNIHEWFVNFEPGEIDY